MWLPAALKRWFDPPHPLLRVGGYANFYNGHMPHYVYGNDRPDCLDCGSDYPCGVARQRARQLDGGRA